MVGVKKLETFNEVRVCLSRATRLFAVLFFMSFLIPLLAVQNSFASLISITAGKAGDHVVTSREVLINHEIENALFNFKNGKPAPAKLNIEKVKDRLFVRETTAVLLETAIYFEAEGFAESKLSAAQIEEKAKLVERRLRRDSLWKSLEVDPKELREILARKLRAKDFIKFKIDSATIPISDQEAENYFKNNRSKFENLPYEKFKENIKNFLTKQQVDRRLKDWFELLQSKYHVRNFLSE